MNRTSISDLKAKAKDQLLGNYGTAAGSFALYFVIVYSVYMIVMSAMGVSFIGTRNGNEAVQSVLSEVITQLVTIAITALASTMSTGFIYVIRRISDEEAASVSDIFFVFRNHPDKVIIISLFMSVPQTILMIPSMIVSRFMYDPDGEALGVDGKMFMIYIILAVLALIISVIIDIYIGMAYQIYIDDPEDGVMNMIKGSIGMMRGNAFRYFYLLLSFIGYALLVVLSLGVTILWVFPYQLMAITEFYKDLRDDAVYEEIL